jgi:hypothetical protein
MHTDQATDPEHAELHDDEGMTPAASELSDAIYALVVGKASLEGLCPNCLLGLAWLHTTVRLILDHGTDFRRVVRPRLERHHPWRAGLLERNRILLACCSRLSMALEFSPKLAE